MRLIISFLFLLILNTTVAQPKKELTEQEYLELQDKIRFSMNGNFDEGLKYAAELQKSSNNEHLAFAYGSGSYLYQLKNNRAKCDEWYKKALEYYNRIPESVQKINLRAYLYNYRGLTEWKRKNFSNALSNYQEGIKLSTKTLDVIQIVKFKSNIALVNEEVGNY
jgi:tetratricopeptide (TPR) repeat protein